MLHRDRLDAHSPRRGTALAHAARSGRSPASYAPLATGSRLTQTGNGPLGKFLERNTLLLKRRAAGTGGRVQQLIAANVAIRSGIVTSCNADFNPARLERYLALAHEAGCFPVCVLTKADMADDPRAFEREAARLAPMLAVEAVDARDAGDVARLMAWCGPGQTAALVGSSGVGKTTLMNGMTGRADATQGIREDDAKGRHTTTARALRPMTHGGWLIDTPGMRALRLHDAADGIDALFSDIGDLAAQCRFSDCGHESEPGCAVRAAIEAGDLDEGRLARWRKLRREDARNAATIAEARAKDRQFGRMVREAMARKRR